MYQNIFMDVTVTKSKKPINELMAILGKKWVLRIIWELNQSPCTFRELQSRCGGVSPTIINARIKDLCSAQLVVKSPSSGYTLSQYGVELMELFGPISDFSKRWAKRPSQISN